ncbi:MAG: glycosyltransferase [Vicinamibacterales bacterium]
MAEPTESARADRRINVMLLTTGLGIGGAEIVVRDLARTLDPDRFDVSICCLRVLGPIGRELEAEGIDITVLPDAEHDRADYFAFVKLRRLLRAKRIDIVHSHTTNALNDGAVCRMLTPGVRLVHTFHFGNYPHRARKILWMERVFSRMADRLVAVGTVQREQVAAMLGTAPDRIEVVRNGVRLPTPGSGDPGFRARVGAEGRLLVGTLSTLIPQKGLHDLIAVARRVRDVRDDVRFVVVGEGDLRRELEQGVRDQGLEDTVLFSGWMTNAAALALPAFDIYFQPSLWEAMSISILEAMAAGKPVVSTLVGEAPHLIEPGVSGLLYQPRDVAGMAAGILDLARSPERRLALGEAAAAVVAGRFTVNHMTRAHERMYEDVLRGGARAFSHVAG